VTEPDVRTAEQARRYAEELQLLLRTIGASYADMERGQMRVEANVSLRRRGSEPFGTRVEVKNMNSFRSVERAINFEIERQAAVLDAAGELVQETRGWSDERGETYRMRVKETSDDYRYFPEPDLPPLRVDAAWLEGIRAGLPELPAARRARYRDELGLSAYDAAVLVADGAAAGLFEATLAAGEGLDPKAVANWVTGEYLRIRADARRWPGRADRAAASSACRRRLDLAGQRGEVLDAHGPRPTVAAIVEARGQPDLGRRRSRRDRRRGHRGEPGGRRRRPGRQGPGDRLPRRGGHEADAGPGQRRRRAGGPERAPGSRCGRGASLMGILNVSLLGAGIALIAVGYLRAREPWRRYRALKEQDANVARYEAWRGGLREGGTGAGLWRSSGARPGTVPSYGIGCPRLRGFALP
jgi:hypothetical protein